MSEIVVMKDVCKSYYSGNEEVKVLKNINLTVKKGEFVSVLGPSGSGKTTLMNIIGCLDVPTSGKYLLCGKDVSEMDETELAAVRNREIGFVFQNFFLLPRLTAIQNVELPLVYSNIPQKERRRKAEKMLYRVGLGDKMHNLPISFRAGSSSGWPLQGLL